MVSTNLARATAAATTSDFPTKRLSFADYAAAGFGADLLPILPHDARVNPNSPMFDSLVANRGKVPGQKRRDGWFGFGDWTQRQANADDHRIWAGWGAGVGMQGRRFPALDIDVDDEELANALQKAAASALGDAPTRFGRGSRRILVYAGADLAKRRLAFRRAEGHADPAEGPAARDCRAPDRQADDVLDQVDERPARAPIQAVEFLASGQQYVLEGIHPKTGQPYWWRDDHSLADTGPAGLAVVDGPAIDAFLDSLEGLLERHGYEIVSRSASSGKAQVFQAGLIAPSLGAIERALASIENNVDYDIWLKIGAAVKAAAGPEDEAEAFELWLAWSLTYGDNTPEMALAKWQSLHPPYKVGWDFLQRFATEEGDGTFYGAAEEFGAVEEAPTPETTKPKADLPLNAMFDRYVWVESVGLIADTRTGALLNREKFNVRNRHIGRPTDMRACAYAVLTSNVPRLQVARAITYRPGAGRFVDENLPGLTGRCVNMWKPTAIDLPAAARNEDVKPWLDHVAFVLPNEKERETVLNWLAWIIQNPGEKPNWAIVMGSTAEGLGKDLMLEPVRAALGAANVREIDADDLASGYSDYLAGTRLLIVEEMQMHERKAMMNRLKPLIAAPPYTLRVNIKFQPQYEIPNLIATIFFTNLENALAIGGKDRRYFVTWNNAQPQPDAYYTELVAWFADGGAAYAARWLLDRDVSGFNAKGKAPMTTAKDDMRKAARSLPDEVLEDGIEHKEGPFAHRLFTLDEATGFMQARIGDRPRLTNSYVSARLKRLGLLRIRRQSLGIQPPGTIAPHLKDAPEHQVFCWTIEDTELDNAAVCTAFWTDRTDKEAMFQ